MRRSFREALLRAVERRNRMFWPGFRAPWKVYVRKFLLNSFCYAPVAQLDRVSGYEPEGREFESLRARQMKSPPKVGFLFGETGR